jgi:hypothetical protein
LGCDVLKSWPLQQDRSFSTGTSFELRENLKPDDVTDAWAGTETCFYGIDNQPS